jgi:phthalate 4,5-cis-dihydrodiol dehydrogenase
MITALNFTDYLYRPRRPEELDSAQGGGAVFSQAPHHADIVRLLGGGRVRTVRAATGNWDPRRPTEGAYSAFLTFAEGASATMTYSGYGHFDSDELLGWVGEMGHARSPEEYGAGRRMLATVATPAEEAALKNTRAYGVARSGGPGAKPAANPVGYNHFGMFVVSCEHADLRPMPDGVMVYADERRWLEPLPAVTVPRAEVVDELLAVVREGQAPLHSAEWGMATVEVCLAILESARTGSEVPLRHQVGVSGARARAQPD